MKLPRLHDLGKILHHPDFTSALNATQKKFPTIVCNRLNLKEVSIDPQEPIQLVAKRCIQAGCSHHHPLPEDHLVCSKHSPLSTVISRSLWKLETFANKLFRSMF